MREKVTPAEMIRQFNNGKQVPGPRDFFEYKPKLYEGLQVASYVHGYSLAIEYMKKWFIDKFGSTYFKYVYVNGSHVLDEWKHFNNYNIRREKPMLAIVPTVDYDYDREKIDSYLMDQKIMLKRSNFQQSFYKDYDVMNFLYVHMKELKMDFGFKVRVNTRAQQQDLYQKMMLWFRVGATQKEFITADFHIPYEIMLNIAKSVGFEIVDDCIVNVCEFVNYMNKHSDLVIMFKMRSINQRPEFFVRAQNLRAHITVMDNLQLDDGERQGKLETDYHVEMRTEFRIPIPYFYAYFSQEPLDYMITVNERSGIKPVYTIDPYEILPQNEDGWGQIAVTGYMTDVGEQHIDMSPILKNGGNVEKVIEHSLRNGISPERFLDLRMYRGDELHRRIPIQMDWEHCILHLNEPEKVSEDTDIVIYGDKGYINDVIDTLEHYTDGPRIGSKN